jgi:hypothetical protein
MMIVKANRDSEAGKFPSREILSSEPRVIPTTWSVFGWNSSDLLKLPTPLSSPSANRQPNRCHLEHGGKKNFLFKAFGLVMNPDKMVGGEFEKGLADLKLLSEQTKIGD